MVKRVENDSFILFPSKLTWLILHISKILAGLLEYEYKSIFEYKDHQWYKTI